MNKTPEQILKELKKVSLSKKEHGVLRTNVISFIKDHESSVRKSDTIRQQKHTRSPYIISSLLVIIKKPMPAFIIALLLLGGGGTSFAAEQAVPGDILYPVKIKFNERVADAAIFSDEAQARWETRKAGRRLEEAAELIEEGTASDEIVDQLEEEFDRHAQKIDELVAKFEADENLSKALEASSHFERSLEAHEDIFEKFKERGGNGINEKTLKHLRGKKEEAAEKREHHEERLAELKEGGFEEAAENRREAVSRQIKQTSEHLARMGEVFGEDAISEALEVLDEARATFAEGEQKLTDGEYEEAFHKFAEARKKSHEAKEHIVREEHDEDEEDEIDDESNHEEDDESDDEDEEHDEDDSHDENEEDEEDEEDSV